MYNRSICFSQYRLAQKSVVQCILFLFSEKKGNSGLPSQSGGLFADFNLRGKRGRPLKNFAIMLCSTKVKLNPQVAVRMRQPVR